MVVICFVLRPRLSKWKTTLNRNKVYFIRGMWEANSILKVCICHSDGCEIKDLLVWLWWLIPVIPMLKDQGRLCREIAINAQTDLFTSIG